MNPAETPSKIESFDCPSLAFNHESGKWDAANEDIYELTQVSTSYVPTGDRFDPAFAERLAPVSGLGQAIAVCPECAFFAEGRCHWCPGKDEPGYPSVYPECKGCLGPVPQRAPWYQRSEVMTPLLTTIAVTVVGTIISTMVLRRVGYK